LGASLLGGPIRVTGMQPHNSNDTPLAAKSLAKLVSPSRDPDALCQRRADET